MDELTTETLAGEPTQVDRASTVVYDHFEPEQRKPPKKKSKLKMPTLAQLLTSTFKHRRHLLNPWLREQESCMVYADKGVGKSLFALSAALAVAGGGEFLGWSPEKKEDGQGWRVLYVDGEMHITDIQERAKMLLDAVADIDRDKAAQNLQLLARQHQDPEAAFPSITEPAGTQFFLERIAAGELDLVVLDNFSTLGEVQDENAASSFNAIQQFLLQLKVQGVATILVHHAKKNSGENRKGGERTGNNFRGSSKLAATFETIIELERIRPQAAYDGAAFRVRWDKVRMGGPQRTVRETVARLSQEFPEDGREGLVAHWEHEAGALQLLDDLKERLIDGQLTLQKEIADLYGVSPTTARNWIDKGIALGMWTEDEVSAWFAKGKRRRRDGKTEAPVKPDYSWKDEALDLEPDVL
jgi:KaiC/GvpD/RAD55 family RecA-like ATPase